MKKKLVHVIEDEEDISKLIEYNLLSQGFNVVCAENGDVALKSIKEEKGDLVLLDIMLPGIDGYRVCEIIKSNDSTRDLPIIMLTAKSQEEEIVKGLEMGADDYITKPISQKLLIARVQNVMRRSANQLISEDEIIEIGEIVIEPKKHKVLLAGEEIMLTPSEYDILFLLAKRRGWVFTRSQIVDSIRGAHYEVTDRTIDFQMVGLRKKLQKMGKEIQTIRGIGYRFREDS